MSDAGGDVAYVDTSALVKLVIHEAETEALQRELRTWRGLASSTVTTIELQRALGRARAHGRDRVSDDEVIAKLLGAVAEIPLTFRVRATAGQLGPVELRTLDAIHVASAVALGEDLGAVVTYDHRMAGAVAAIGLRIIAPA